MNKNTLVWANCVFTFLACLLCSDSTAQESGANKAVKMKVSNQKPFRVVFLGDSITQAGARPGGYVSLARTDLEKKFEGIKVIGAGISGNKVPDLLMRLDKDVLGKDPTHVVIYIGINDVWHFDHGKGTSPNVFRGGLERLVNRIQSKGAIPVLCTPTVIGEKVLGENPHDAKLELYSQISRRVAKAKNIPLIDLRKSITDYLDRQPNQKTRDKGWLLTGDGVHLNKKGNQWLSSVMVSELSKVLRAKKGGMLRHLVLFKFKDDVPSAEVKKIVKAFGNLPGQINEISEYEAGTNVSPEKLDQGFTHAFMVTFENAAGRDIYLPHPAHKAFVKILKGKLDKVLVVDFQDANPIPKSK